MSGCSQSKELNLVWLLGWGSAPAGALDATSSWSGPCSRLLRRMFSSNEGVETSPGCQRLK